MKTTINIDEVTKFIRNQSIDSKIYIGCDSKLVRKNRVLHADYVTVVVIHMACLEIPGRYVGGKIFADVVRERDYTNNLKKPGQRLLTEVSKAAMLYEQLSDAIGKRYVEIHLDINSDPEHASYSVSQQAIGYIRGVSGLTPKIKPDAFAASACADRFLRVENYDINKPTDKENKYHHHRTKSSFKKLRKQNEHAQR